MDILENLREQDIRESLIKDIEYFIEYVSIKTIKKS